MASDYDLTVTTSGDETLVVIRGDLDAHTALPIGQAFAAAMASGTRFVRVDASEVRFVDSTGLRLLYVTARAIRREGGEFWIEAASLPLRRIVEVSNLAPYVGLHL
jgi:anti-anti-sigma factor